MYENEIRKCEQIIEKIEKFGFVKNEAPFVNALLDETREIIIDCIDNDSKVDKDTLRAFKLAQEITEQALECFVPYAWLSKDIEDAEFEARYGSNRQSAFRLIPFVKKINAIFCIENPNKAPNRVAFGWNNAFDKDNPRAYLLGCIRNYLNNNGVEYEDDELKMIVGFKKDPFFIDELGRYVA